MYCLETWGLVHSRVTRRFINFDLELERSSFPICVIHTTLVYEVLSSMNKPLKNYAIVQSLTDVIDHLE